MSDSSSSAQSALTNPLGPGNRPAYQLSDDLARLCLPHEWKDSCRTLAWVNSVCFLFLVVGLVGLKPPRVIHRPLKEVAEVVPVIFTPPPEQPKTDTDVKPDEPETPQDTPDVPQVVQVIAAADPASVAFSVPVQGAVALASQAHLATPPPLVTHLPTGPVKFSQSTHDGGSYPSPSYPAIALRNREEGTAVIEIRVDASGAITETKVQHSSGHPVLDEAAIEVVRRRWHFPPGHPQWLSWSCTFQMQ